MRTESVITMPITRLNWMNPVTKLIVAPKLQKLVSIALLTAVSITFVFNEANAAFSAQVGTPNVSFSISDYQPAPPNVYVQSDRGRPYYVERDRRVYMEKRKPGKHYKEKKHHEDRDHDEGHDRGNKHGH